MLEDPLGVEVHRLDNGLQVWLSPNREEARVACRVVVRAGSAQEPRDATGVAHLLEHMLANKGTRRLGRNEAKQLYGQLGARGLNAMTGTDHTSYVVDVPADRLAAWAAVEGDRFSEPVLRAFDTELEVVREEKRRGLDDPARQLRELHARMLFGEHPYAAPILGEIPHLLSLQVEQLEAFRRRWYVPSNMAVVLAGDFEPQRALGWIAEAFSSLEGLPPERIELAPQGLDDPLRGELEHRGSPGLRIGWLTVPPGHPDEDALRLAGRVLSNGSTGLIDRNLVQAQRIGAGSAAVSFRPLAGSFLVSGRPRAGQALDELETLLLEQVEELKRGRFDAGLLEAIVRNQEVAELRALEKNASRVHRMSYAILRGLSWEVLCSQRERLRALDVDSVAAAARAWLGPARATALRHSGEPRPPAFPVASGLEDSPPGDEHSPFFREVLAAVSEPRGPQVLRAGEDWQSAQLPGLRIHRVRNPFSDLCSLTLRHYTGAQLDPGITTALPLWRTAGVRGRSRSELEEQLYGWGSRLTVSAGRYHVDFSLHGPADLLPRGLELLGDWMEQPVLERAERVSWLEDRIERRRATRTTVAFARRALKAWAHRGARSILLELRRTDAQLRALADEDLGLRIGSYRSGGRLAVFTGASSLESLRDWLSVEALEDPPVHAPIGFERPERARVLLLHHASAQTEVALHLPHEAWGPEGWAARRLWAEYFGGGAGLVFTEARERRGLAYSARAGWQGGWRAGDDMLASASVVTAPDKAAATAELLVSLLRAPSWDAERWGRARAAALAGLRGQRVGFRSIGWSVERWRLRGWKDDPRPLLVEQLEAAGAEDLQGLMRSLAAAPMTLTIVGDLQGLDREALRALGELQELELSQLTT